MRQLSMKRSIVLLVVMAVVFFFQLGTPQLWDRDEPRNAGAAREMLARGDWIVPTFNAELRDHKPVLLYWGQMVAAQIVGDNEWSARLPSALAAVLSVLFTAVLASRLTGRTRGISQEGFWAAAVLSTSLLFVMAGRAATPDACLVTFSTLGIVLLVLGSVVPAPPYASGRVGTIRWWSCLWGYAALGVAALAKGPVGIILPLAVVHAWWLVCYRLQQRQSPTVVAPVGRWRAMATELWQTFGPVPIVKCLWRLKTLPGLVIALAVAAPWYVLVGLETDGAFLRGFFLEHNLGRATRPMEGHDGGLLFYPAMLLVGTFPWSLWLIPVLMWAKSAYRENVALRQLAVLSACWVAVYVVAFSVARTKLPSYITPCYPGVALLLGCFLRQFETQWWMPRIGWRKTFYLFALLLGVLLSGGVLMAAAKTGMPGVRIAALGGIAITAVGVCGWLLDLTGAARAVPSICLIGATVFQAMVFAIGASAASAYRQDLTTLRQLQQELPCTTWLSLNGLEPSWVYYVQQPIESFYLGQGETPDQLRSRLLQRMSEHPTGRLIVVGNRGRELFSALGDAYVPQSYEIHFEASAPLFLQDETIDIYRWEPVASRAARWDSPTLR
ncbi:MAG: hypothetical protein KatS3mg111_1415 [Pirellulaceae bacterium]|nr:MAG: hypothetical protein KatS3mg111_1415 [Pirellulaceae bacterium]